jgi:lactate racemase
MSHHLWLAPFFAADKVMEIKLKYGKGVKTLRLPDQAEIHVMAPHDLPVLPDVESSLREALDNPLGTQSLDDRSKPRSVAIAVPDETRPVPLKTLLPVLLNRIFQAWPDIDPGAVTIVVGGGLHPAPDKNQMARILPEDLLGCSLVAHDALASPMTIYGTTSRGTPVEINAAIGEAELKIVVGMIDPHQYQGMTGGFKGVVIGCASKAMIERNHSLMSLNGAVAGNIQDNPVRQDLEEAGRMIGIDLAINVCLNSSQKVVAVIAGNPESVLRSGAGITQQLYGLPLGAPFEIVIAACGGYPKDICLYQAQKGLNTASQCTATGGRILLLAACDQGVGDQCYLDYVRKFTCPSSQMKEFEELGFRMGAHKAYLFSRTLTRFTVVVDSELDEQTLAHCHLTKGNAQETLDSWFEEIASERIPRVGVLPNANSSYFYAL